MRSLAMTMTFALTLACSTLACSGADATGDAELTAEQSGAATAVSDSALETALNNAAAGLLYQSEGDFPYEFVKSQQALPAGKRVTGKTVRAAFLGLGAQANGGTTSLRDMPDWDYTSIEVFEADDPEDPEIDPEIRATYEKFNTVRKVLRDNLSDVKVIRFGKKPILRDGPNRGRKARWVESVEGQVQIFIVGRSKASGKVVGLRTTSIET